MRYYTEKPTVEVHLTNGFGNNLFQYIYARLLSEFHNLNLSVISPFKNYYAREHLENVGLCIKENPTQPGKKIILINASCGGEFKKYFNKKYSDSNFVLCDEYFEDYTLYKDHLWLIRSWFSKVDKANNDDLVFHLRLGDRLIDKNNFHHSMKVDPQKYSQVIKSFKFNKLYIVTDMPKWEPLTETDVLNLRFHIDPIKIAEKVDPKISADYFNSLFNEFLKFKPIVRFGGKDISGDFNFIRSFDKILFQHSTMAWWAAAISDATKIGVFKEWRPVKGMKNKNLGCADFPGWFGW